MSWINESKNGQHSCSNCCGAPEPFHDELYALREYYLAAVAFLEKADGDMLPELRRLGAAAEAVEAAQDVTRIWQQYLAAPNDAQDERDESEELK